MGTTELTVSFDADTSAMWVAATKAMIVAAVGTEPASMGMRAFTIDLIFVVPRGEEARLVPALAAIPGGIAYEFKDLDDAAATKGKKRTATMTVNFTLELGPDFDDDELADLYLDVPLGYAGMGVDSIDRRQDGPPDVTITEHETVAVAEGVPDED